jgi:hypothetical protein
MEMKVKDPYLDINQNPILGELLEISINLCATHQFTLLAQDFSDVVGSRYGWLY